MFGIVLKPNPVCKICTPPYEFLFVNLGAELYYFCQLGVSVRCHGDISLSIFLHVIFNFMQIYVLYRIIISCQCMNSIASGENILNMQHALIPLSYKIVIFVPPQTMPWADGCYWGAGHAMQARENMST